MHGIMIMALRALMGSEGEGSLSVFEGREGVAGDNGQEGRGSSI